MGVEFGAWGVFPDCRAAEYERGMMRVKVNLVTLEDVLTRRIVREMTGITEYSLVLVQYAVCYRCCGCVKAQIHLLEPVF